MEALKLRFVDRDQPELTLGVGVHGIGKAADGGDALELVGDTHAPTVRFCVDRRGVWLTVAEGARGVHVNGREVRRMAMLRAGDAVYVDGIEMRLLAASPPQPPDVSLTDAAQESVGDPRVVLRGVGGRYHGRSFTLERPRLVGSAGEADIRIEDPAFADRHARLELISERIVLRDLGSVDGSLVNGETVRDAVLQPGDQIVFDAHHRFVVEAPARPAPDSSRTFAPVNEKTFDFNAIEEARAPRSPARRLPWVLLAAVLIAGLLAALLLFGSG